MTSRILAPLFGVIAGIAAAAFCRFAWNDALALASITAPDTVAALWLPVNRAAWAITGTITAFAVVAQATALAGGILETILTRGRIAALAPDWNAVFVRTSIAAAALSGGGARQTGWDPPLRLEPLWLDTLTIGRLIGPLPSLVLAAGGALALFSDISGTGWEIAFAAGLCGWLLISLARYLAAIALSPFVARTVAAMVEAARTATAAAPATQSPDAGAIARDVADILAEPLERLADAADRLGQAQPSPPREFAIDAALADIRAGIERLLAASRNP
jgi:hypothetical protein